MHCYTYSRRLLKGRRWENDILTNWRKEGSVQDNRQRSWYTGHEGKTQREGKIKGGVRDAYRWLFIHMLSIMHSLIDRSSLRFSTVKNVYATSGTAGVYFSGWNSTPPPDMQLQTCERKT